MVIDSRNNTTRINGCCHGIAIDAEVGLCPSGGSGVLLRLHISLPGLPPCVADPRTGDARQTCPYCKIIDVT